MHPTPVRIRLTRVGRILLTAACFAAGGTPLGAFSAAWLVLGTGDDVAIDVARPLGDIGIGGEPPPRT